MTALAIGAASRFPPTSIWRSLPPFSSTTATATAGLSAGAKETNQASGFLPSPVCAVPVLPATFIPEIAALVPVPLSTTPTIMAVNSAATCGEIACE